MPGKTRRGRGATPTLTELFPVTARQQAWVRSVISHMPLRRKAGQVVVPGFNAGFANAASVVSKTMETLTRIYGVGGFCFFNGTVRDYAAITTHLQRVAEVPLLMSADFERGIAMRIQGATEFPSHMGLAAAGSPALTRKVAAVIAHEAKTIGIHQNFAPVADNNTDWRNPIVNTRAFSDSPAVTARYCKAFIQGTATHRVLATAKHFPGHGRTWVDSHRDMPVITVGKDEMLRHELLPFMAAVRAGVHSVMVGHLQVPALEPALNLPASLSGGVITAMLRGEMGFNGLVVTDAMNMYAVTDRFSAAEAAVRAINAGIDMLLFPPDPEIACDAIHEALLSGVISEARINASIERILYAKCWAQCGRVPSEAPDDVVSAPAHTQLARRASAMAVVISGNKNNCVPLPADGTVVCVNVLADEGADSQLLFGKELGQHRYVQQFVLNSSTKAKGLKEIATACASASSVVFAVYLRFRAYRGEIGIPEQFIKRIEGLRKTNKKSVLVIFGSPYVAKFLPGTGICVFAFSDAPNAQAAVADAIAGVNKITGSLPVTI